MFLDRDGVINRAVNREGVSSVPFSLDELEIVPGASGELERLKSSGFLLLVVSNQPDVARERITEREVEEINRVLIESLPIEAVYYCPHDEDDGCPCRKPRVGMLEVAAAEWGVDRERSLLIGDRWVDIAAARAAGCTAILLEHELSWAASRSGLPSIDLKPDFVGKNLTECVNFVLSRAGW